MQSTIHCFAIRQRPYLGRGYLIAGLFLAAALPLSMLAMRAPAAHTGLSRPAALHPSCIVWDEIATTALYELAVAEPTTAKRQRTDASFRLNRARRSCAAGWLTIACADYQALISGPLPRGYRKLHPLAIPKICTASALGL